MKTFKIIFLLATLLVATNIEAQDKKASFGIKAGLNISDLASTDDKNFNNTNAKVGFHAGVTLDYAFTSKWYLLTGLEYTSKGVKIDFGGESRNQDITAAYVQLPVCAGFKFRASNTIAILFNLGPYVAYGLHGKIKTGTSHKQDTFSDVGLKKFDSGLSVGATLEWQKLCIGFGGDMGLLNIMQNDNNKAKSQNVTISVGYKF